MHRPRRRFVALAIASVGMPYARAQGNPPRIAYVAQVSAASGKWGLDALRSGLLELGHVEGRTFTLDAHYADGDLDRSARLIREAAASNPAVLCVAGLTAARRAHEATKTVPIVMLTGSDLVDAGLARTLSRPGLNVTGVADNSDAITLKRLDYARELLPAAKRVALVVNPDFPATPKIEKQVSGAAAAAKLSLTVLRARDVAGVVTAIESLGTRGADVLLVGGDALFVVAAKAMIDKATALSIPVVHYWPTTPELGAVLVYAVDVADNYRRAAWHVDRILKGESAATLPVHQPTRYELVVNVQAARRLGIAIPPALLGRADRRID